jgi:ribosomal protein S6--L-glutamate ligase
MTDRPRHQPVVALERRLRGCKNVVTLGVKPNFLDYSPIERAFINGAEKIYYPSSFYADLFDAMGKKTFPSYHTYKCVQDKIKQTALFEMTHIPYPRTRVFYGRRQQKTILEYFDFPFVAKVPRGSAMGRGVFLIENRDDLEGYLAHCRPAYIQKYLPIDRDIRLVVIGHRVIHAYWRVAPAGDFRTNVSVGGAGSLDPVPPAAMDLAVDTACRCGWDDVGIDICRYQGNYFVLEANMKYGKEGFRAAGIDYNHLMERMIADGEI